MNKQSFPLILSFLALLIVFSGCNHTSHEEGASTLNSSSNNTLYIEYPEKESSNKSYKNGQIISSSSTKTNTKVGFGCRDINSLKKSCPKLFYRKGEDDYFALIDLEKLMTSYKIQRNSAGNLSLSLQSELNLLLDCYAKVFNGCKEDGSDMLEYFKVTGLANIDPITFGDLENRVKSMAQ